MAHKVQEMTRWCHVWRKSGLLELYYRNFPLGRRDGVTYDAIFMSQQIQ